LTEIYDAATTRKISLGRSTETSTLGDVEAFLAALGARSDLLRVSSFGTSQDGRPLWLASLSNPPVAQPRDLRALDRPVVFVQANIHGGEVEGKEAVQNLMRRLALGDLRSMLDRVVVLIAPVYNVDGNEAFDLNNRTDQYGPIAGVGRRENSNGLDLNRDYMKLDSPEARALVRLYDTWDPHVVVDLHTTNGSAHGYHLTYSIPLNLSFDARLMEFHREALMPRVAAGLLQRHGFRSYYYGNFEGPKPKAGESDTRRWSAFDHRPRIGQNYVGLRNRVTVLSEAYSYLDFKRRIDVTEAFVEEILRDVESNAATLMALTRDLDRDFVRRALGEEEMMLGVKFEARAVGEDLPLLVGEVTREINPRNNKPMTVIVDDKFSIVNMPDFGIFAPVREVPMARVYVMPREAGMEAIVDKLVQHGILVEELIEPLDCELTSFQVKTLSKSTREFQKHNEVTLTGEYTSASASLPAGTIVVRLAQPLGRLAAYLLEPESDDGLLRWNFFDAWLAVDKPAPVLKIMRTVPLSARALESL
jgi:hypothetical protein